MGADDKTATRSALDVILGVGEPWPEGVPAQEVLWDMKRNGLPRPDNVPRRLWDSPQSINYNHENIADLLMLGYTKKEVAAKLEMHYQSILVITRSITFKTYFRERRKNREEALSRDGITDLFDVAVDTVGEIIQDEQAKQHVRLAASQFVIEQSVGKAKQEVKVESTNLHAQVLARIDELKKMKSEGVTSGNILDKTPNRFQNVLDALQSGTNCIEVNNNGEESEQEP